ncbi:MAG: hypothetical protein OEV47_09670, partial [Gammaproteobacteria bacterium]|nr:hypothetical protein [Gammaproteobacteria bacterium]
MLQFKPHGISLPLVTFGPIAGLEVGTEARFPEGGMGIVTAVGSKTTVQYLGTPLNISRETKVRFTNRVLSFNFDQQGIIGRTLDPLGRPLDDRPEVVGEALPIYGGILNPTRRTLAEGLIQHGIP